MSDCVLVCRFEAAVEQHNNVSIEQKDMERPLRDPRVDHVALQPTKLFWPCHCLSRSRFTAQSHCWLGSLNNPMLTVLKNPATKARAKRQVASTRIRCRTFASRTSSEQHPPSYSPLRPLRTANPAVLQRARAGSRENEQTAFGLPVPGPCEVARWKPLRHLGRWVGEGFRTQRPTVFLLQEACKLITTVQLELTCYLRTIV